MDDDDIVGALTVGEYLGAPRRRGGYVRRAPQRSGYKLMRPQQNMVPRVPGVPGAGMRLQALGFGAQAFTNTSGTSLTFVANPQRPFQGKRLVVDLTRTGASATGLVTLTRLDIGSNNQLVSSGAVGIAAFASTAVDVNLELDVAGPGITITAVLAVSAAPTATDRIDISVSLLGAAIG